MNDEPVTSATLTDELIREEWNSLGILIRAECYYALKRNARACAGVQGDDTFSLFCEESAVAVAEAINKRRSLS